MSPSSTAIAVANSASSGDYEINLLTFSSPGIDTFRLTSDKTEVLSLDGPVSLWGTRSRGEVYDYVGFTVLKPGYKEGETPEIRIQLPLIDREKMLPLIRAYRENTVRCLVETVLESDPDAVTDRFVGFVLRKAPWNGSSVQLVLQLTRYDLEPFPAGEMTPDSFPGLFP